MGEHLEMTGGPAELTADETARRAGLVAAVVRYAAVHQLAAARALRAIHDERLYRPWTWTAFCDDRLPVTKRHADRLIAYAEVVDAMGPQGPAPTNEKQARVLQPLTEEQREQVAAAADYETGGRGFEGLTSARVRDWVQEITGDPGSVVIPIDERALVQTKRGPVPLERSGFLRLLDKLEAAARSMRLLGPHALPDAVRAVPPEDRERRADQIMLIWEVARDLFNATEAWPGGVKRRQEPLIVDPYEHPPLPRSEPPRAIPQ